MKTATVHGAEDCITESALAESTTQLVSPHSVLIVVRSGILRHSLPVALNAVPVALNQDLKAITPHREIEAAYIAWAIRRFEEQILHTCTKAGTTVQSVETSKLRQFEIPLAPLVEQRRIVAALEAHLSDLDAAVAGLERARANVGRYQSAAREVALQDQPRVMLGELLAEPLANGRSVPTAETGFPVLRLTALRNGRIELSEKKIGAWSEDEARSYFVREGDFLVARGNGSRALVGRGGLVGMISAPVAFPDTLIRVRPDTTRLLPEYLRLAWDGMFVRRQIEERARTTAGIYKINQGDVEAMLVQVPSDVATQRAIAENLEAAIQRASRTATEIDIQLARAARLRQSILKRAFEGKLVPQDPSDEPAAVLLDRIRAARGTAPAGAARGRRTRTARG